MKEERDGGRGGKNGGGRTRVWVQGEEGDRRVKEVERERDFVRLVYLGKR